MRPPASRSIRSARACSSIGRVRGPSPTLVLAVEVVLQQPFDHDLGRSRPRAPSTTSPIPGETGVPNSSARACTPVGAGEFLVSFALRNQPEHAPRLVHVSGVMPARPPRCPLGEEGTKHFVDEAAFVAARQSPPPSSRLLDAEHLGGEVPERAVNVPVERGDLVGDPAGPVDPAPEPAPVRPVAPGTKRRPLGGGPDTTSIRTGSSESASSRRILGADVLVAAPSSQGPGGPAPPAAATARRWHRPRGGRPRRRHAGEGCRARSAKAAREDRSRAASGGHPSCWSRKDG